MKKPKCPDWSSLKIKNILSDFDGEIGSRIVSGKAGDHRTECITFKPFNSENKLEIMGFNGDIDITFKNRKSVEVQFIEVRGAIDSDDEQILILNSILVPRLLSCGYLVEEKEKFKKLGFNYNY